MKKKTLIAPNTALLAQPEGKLAMSRTRSDRFRFYGKNSLVREGDITSSRLVEDAMTVEATQKHLVSSPPIDKSITSIYISGINDDITEQILQTHFSTYGKLQKIIFVPENNGAYVLFEDRSAAEKAMDATCGPFSLRGTNLNIQWGTMKRIENHPMATSLLYHHLSVYDETDNNGDA